MFGDEVSFDGIELPANELIKALEETKKLKEFAKKIYKKIFSKKSFVFIRNFNFYN